MSNRIVNIEYSKIENDKVLVLIYVDGKNVSSTFALYEFVNEMEFLGIKSKFQKVNSRVGFIFEDDIDKTVLENEIKRFAKQFDIT
ncbi:hypothetical protein SH1V18_10820 [Vallitalea longa]|uniref:Uncharacterized protein n=1 Tax=Vallitalea longa TaxID=2936439 RepID=A0A9W5Y887_9FIRM|nr:hypothetical protein [Vallitalea longa]GKX28602.1 hypothetical protein SH1V18_10820 [Vallitalea longa]